MPFLIGFPTGGRNAAPGSRYDLTREPSTTGPLPLVFGTARVEGRYVTLWDRLEPEADSAGAVRPATYTARIALCQGPASGYRRIWIDGKLVPSAANPGQTQGLFSYHNLQSATYIDPYAVSEDAAKLSLLGPFADRSFAFIAGDYAEGDWTYQSPRTITGYWEPPVWHPPSEGNAGYYDPPVWNAGTTTPHVWPRNVDTDPRPPLGGVCHLRLTRLQAPASDAPPKVDVEVLGLHRSGLTGDGAPLADDANPCDVLTTLLTSSVYSWPPLLSSSELEVDVGADGTAASSARRYCQAMGFYVSRAIEAYTPILDLVAELLHAMNCIAFWSEGRLKVRPLGDRVVTGYGVTYTPVLTATSLTTALGDFVGEASSLVTCSRVGNRDVRNVVALKYRRRDNLAHIYGEETVEAAVRYDAAVRGITARDEVSNGWITREAHAAAVAHLLADANVTRRTSYACRLGPRHQALEPGDMVTLTEPVFGLAAVPCRVVETVENDGYVEVVAEEWPGLPASALVIASRPTPMDGAQLGRDTGQTALTVAMAAPVNILAAVTPTTREDGTPLVAGDVWIDSDDGNHPHIWSGSAWVSTRDGTISVAQATADGRNRTFYQNDAPTASAVGDLWFDLNDGNKCYRWSGSAWVAVQDGAIATAQGRADDAFTLASSKAKVTYAATPPASPATGDLWFSTDTTTDCPDDNCRGHTDGDGDGIPDVSVNAPHRALYWPHRWDGTAWVDGQGSQLVTASEIAAGAIVAAKIAAGAITAAKIQADALATTDWSEASDVPGSGAKMLANTTYTAWASNTAYAVGDKRSNGGKVFRCSVDGTSAGGAAAWGSGTTYAVGNLVSYSGRTYYSLQSGNTNHQPDINPAWWEDRGANTGPALTGFGVVLDGTVVWIPYAQLRASPSGLQIGTATLDGSWFTQQAYDFVTVWLSGTSFGTSGIHSAVLDGQDGNWWAVDNWNGTTKVLTLRSRIWRLRGHDFAALVAAQKDSSSGTAGRNIRATGYSTSSTYLFLSLQMLDSSNVAVDWSAEGSGVEYRLLVASIATGLVSL